MTIIKYPYLHEMKGIQFNSTWALQKRKNFWGLRGLRQKKGGGGGMGIFQKYTIKKGTTKD